MLTTVVRPFIRPCFTRTYATASSGKELPFIYQYATPLMKCTAIAIATNLTLQALFNTLEYADYRKGMDGKMEEIEERLRKLEGKNGHSY
ncbi:hypothetical protein INT44_007729 [Umbelopsis vinacea]|uniref:Uncharacterized protein n=1 Tax=Umbelopsis vinacea TaxID=44442 RepID=A0A8H7PJU2_9FUNG|nr:hypothetical protein INT44_007729 [Umbelopsis vinacea]